MNADICAPGVPITISPDTPVSPVAPIAILLFSVEE